MVPIHCLWLFVLIVNYTKLRVTGRWASSHACGACLNHIKWYGKSHLILDSSIPGFGPWICMKAGWVCYHEQAIISTHFLPLNQLILPGTCCLSSVLTSFSNRLWCESTNQLHPFRPNLLLVIVFHHSKVTPTKTLNLRDWRLSIE